MANDGLLLGAAILGGGYLAINALNGEDGGGGGGSGAGGVVNIIDGAKDAIEGAATAAQGITSTVKEVSYFFDRAGQIVDDTKEALTGDGHGYNLDFGAIFGGDDTPTGNKAPFFETASAAGGGFGAGIGGALGSAFLGMYSGAITAGANFAGRQDVTPQNALNKFTTALPVAKDNIISGAANNVVNAFTFKSERDFVGSVYNAAKSHSSGGNSSIFTPHAVNIPKTNNIPIGGSGSTAFKQSHADFVATFRAKNAAPATVKATEAKKTIYGSVRSWFN